MQHIIFKDTPLFFQDQGNGKAVLFIHGFLENHRMWTPFIPYFSTHCRCIAPDLFGHGQSPALGYKHSMKMYAQALAKLIDHLQVSSYSIVGHSMGGYVAMELLRLQPDKIIELVMLNSTPLADSDEKKENRTRAIRAIQKWPDAFVQMAVNNLFLPEDRILLGNEIEQTIEEAKKCSLQGIIATLQGLKDRENHLDTFNNASCNKLVIAGKQDSIASYPELKASIAGSKAKLLSFYGGHMSHLEFPKEVQQALANFINLG